MHVMDDSLVDRKRKKKKRKHEDIIRQNSFTNDADVGLVNNYVINKYNGDVTEIKKHKKKRKNSDHNRNEAFVTQNGIDAEIRKPKRKRSHSGELITDSKLLLNNIKVEDDLGVESVSKKKKKHHSSDTPHYFGVNQKYSKRNDFGSNPNKDRIIETKMFKPYLEYGINGDLSIHHRNIKGEGVDVKKKKKKRHKDLDTMTIETWDKPEFGHFISAIPSQTDTHNKHKDCRSNSNLLPNTSWDKKALSTQHCNVNDGLKKKKKKRPKDGIANETDTSQNVTTVKQHKEMRYSLLNETWEKETCDNEVGTKKRKKKRHKDTIEPVAQSSALVDHSATKSNVNHFLTNTSWEDKTRPIQLCNSNGETEKKRKKKRHKGTMEPVAQSSALVGHSATESNVNDFLTNTSWENKTRTTQLCNSNGETEKKRKKKHHKDTTITNVIPDESRHITTNKHKQRKNGGSCKKEIWSPHNYNINDEHHKKTLEKEHHKNTGTESGHHKYFSPNDSCGSEILSTQHYNINDQHHKKKRKKEHHKDRATDKSESGHHRNFLSKDFWGSETLSTQHFNVNGKIEKKKTKKKRQEEDTMDEVKSERIDEIENQINLTDFVLNETPQHVVSEKPAELGKVAVDKKQHRVNTEVEDNRALFTAQRALPQLDSNENVKGLTPVDCVDITEKEKTGTEQSNATDTGFEDCSITSSDHVADVSTKDDHNNNEGEERQKHSDMHQTFYENSSTVESFNAVNQTEESDTTREEPVLNSNLTFTSDLERHVERKDDADQSHTKKSEIPRSEPQKRKHEEIPTNILKGVDFVKHYLDKASVRTKLTEDNKQLLEQLHVSIPFEIPQAHLIETRMSSHPTKKQQARFDELGLKMNVKHYNEVEDNIIKDNWTNFCKMHDLPNDPSPFMSFEACSDTKMNGSILSKPERIKFVQFLGQKLEHRYLYGIYRRFKKLFEVVKKGRFSQAEDDLIWDYIKQSDDTNQFSKLAYVLNRDRHRILMRYRLLKAQREPGGEK